MPGDAARRVETNTWIAEQAYATAPDELRAELLNGIVCMSPAPMPRHQRVLIRLSWALRRFDRSGHLPNEPGGWVFLPEPELHLGTRPDKMKPDIAGWREERATFPMEASGILVPPDWVCEILSPSTETIDRGTKAPLYAQHGVEWLWLVDPENAQIEVFHNERGVFRPVNHPSQMPVPMPFESVSVAGLFDA